MQNIAQLISFLTLSFVVVPCLVHFDGAIGHDAVKWTALAGTIGWFISTHMSMSRELPIDAPELEN